MSKFDFNKFMNSAAKPLCLAMFTLGAAFGLGIRSGLETQISDGNVRACKQVEIQSNYEKLQPGMSLLSAYSRIGPGKETKQSLERKTIEWHCAGEGAIVAIFDKQEQLIEKTLLLPYKSM